MAIAAERAKLQSLFASACSHGPQWAAVDGDRQASIVRRLERGCYNNAVISCATDGFARHFSCRQFVDRYSANCHRVLRNLDPRSEIGSTYLIDAICSDKIAPETAADLAPSELCPAANQAVRDEIAVRKMQKIVQKVSRMHTCRKCGRDETVSVEYVQNCADEATKHSIKCIHCGNIWRK